MGRELGRISGPLLTNNLLRNGTDLSFESSLLYLNVNNRKVGINTSTPTRDLEILGTTLTNNIIIDTQLDINNNYEINTNTITNFLDKIIVSPANTVGQGLGTVYTGGTQTDQLKFLNNNLTSLATISSIFSGTFKTRIGFIGDPVDYNSVNSGNIETTPSNIVYEITYSSNFSATLVTFTNGTYGLNLIDATGINGATSISLTVNGVTHTNDQFLGSAFPQGPTYWFNGDPWNLQGTVGVLQTFSLSTSYYPDINLSPTGTMTNFNSNVLVNGSLHATGDVTWDGDVILGSNSSNLIDLYAEIGSSIFPDKDATYNIGSSTLYFGTTYVNNYNSNSLTGKSLNPVVSINYPPLQDGTKLTISGNTITLPSTGINITSANGSGVLNFSDDIVYNGGFETGDTTGWTFGGGSISLTILDSGGFDTVGLNGIFNFAYPYTGTSILYTGLVDNYTIQFNPVISIFQLGTTIYGGYFYTGKLFIGNATNTTCQLFATLLDSENLTNPLQINSILDSYGNPLFVVGYQYLVNTQLTVSASIYQSGNQYPLTVFTTYQIATTDKIMFSMHIDYDAGLPIYIGVGTHQTNINYPLGINGRSGGNVSSYAFISTGQDTNGNTTPSFGTGDTVDVAVDRVINKIWIRVTGGSWNNDPTQDPTLGRGGFDISYLTILTGGNNVAVSGNYLYPGVSINYQGDFLLGSGDQITLETITTYSVPGNFVLAHYYPSAAHKGIYYEFIGPYQSQTATLTQTLQTYPNMNYTVSWYVKTYNAATNTQNPPQVSISFNGVILDTVVNDVDVDWHLRSYPVTATGYTTDIVITLTNSGANYYFDDIACVGLFPYFKNNTIQNVTGGTLTIQNTGNGYTDFNMTSGAVLPVGNNSNYPSVVQTGLTRYNSDKGIAEVYNGTAWQMIADVTGYATQDEIQNIINVWSIILG